MTSSHKACLRPDDNSIRSQRGFLVTVVLLKNQYETGLAISSLLFSQMIVTFYALKVVSLGIFMKSIFTKFEVKFLLFCSHRITCKSCSSEVGLYLF